MDLLKAATACSVANTAASVVEAISGAADELGFPYYAVFEAVIAADRTTLLPILGKSHDAWLVKYREANLAVFDLRLRKGRLSSRDFFCSEVLRDDPAVTPGERQFFDEANAFGIHDSYVLPYRTAGGRVFRRGAHWTRARDYPRT